MRSLGPHTGAPEDGGLLPALLGGVLGPGHALAPTGPGATEGQVLTQGHIVVNTHTLVLILIIAIQHQTLPGVDPEAHTICNAGGLTQTLLPVSPLGELQGQTFAPLAPVGALTSTSCSLKWRTCRLCLVAISACKSLTHPFVLIVHCSCTRLAFVIEPALLICRDKVSGYAMS